MPLIINTKKGTSKYIPSVEESLFVIAESLERIATCLEDKSL